MIRGGNIGAMDVYLTLQTPVKTYDSVTNEQLKDSWATVDTLWAEKLNPPPSHEKFEGNQTVDIGAYKFRIRYYPGITTQMRFMRTVDGDPEYNYITGIDEMDRSTFQIVTTERRDNSSDGTVVTDVLGTSITFQDEGITL